MKFKYTIGIKKPKLTITNNQISQVGIDISIFSNEDEEDLGVLSLFSASSDNGREPKDHIASLVSRLMFISNDHPDFPLADEALQNQIIKALYDLEDSITDLAKVEVMS